MNRRISGKRLPVDIRIHFTRTLSELLNAGIDLPSALETYASLTSNRMLQSACLHQAEGLLNGQAWPELLAESRQPIWPVDLIAWASVAQRTGNLVTCLDFLTNDWSKAGEFHQQLGRKLAYPSAVLLLSLALAWFTGTQFSADMQSLFLLTAGVIAGIVGIAGVTALVVLRKDGLSEMHCWSRCSRALALCTESGLSWPASLELLIEELQSLWCRHKRIGLCLQECLDAIGQGKTLQAAGEIAGLPGALLRSLRLAPITGDLSSALSQACRLLEIQNGEISRRLHVALPAAAMMLAALTLATQYALFIKPLYEQMGAL